MKDGVELMLTWLAHIGVDPSKVVLDTGSGLSYNSRLSAKQIVTVLRAAAGYSTEASPKTDAFRDSLAIGAVDGTLRGRFKTPGHTVEHPVVGKTGTLTSVIALSGFISDRNGRTLCFSILTNGHKHARRRIVRSEHESMVAKLDRYLNELGTRNASGVLPAAAAAVPAPAQTSANSLALTEATARLDQPPQDVTPREDRAPLGVLPATAILDLPASSPL